MLLQQSRITTSSFAVIFAVVASHGFPANGQYLGRNNFFKFPVQYVTFKISSRLNLSSVTSVFTPWVRSKRELDHCDSLDLINVDISYNKDNKNLKITTNYSNPHDPILRAYLVNGSTRSECMVVLHPIPLNITSSSKDTRTLLSSVQYHSGNYCVRIATENCNNYAYSNVFSFNRSDPVNASDCFDNGVDFSFNMTIVLRPNQKNKELNIIFGKKSAVKEECCNISSYEVVLILDNNTPRCAGTTVNSTTVTSAEPTLSASFATLNFGRYCVRVIPNCSKCPVGFCKPFYSNVVELREEPVSNITAINNVESSLPMKTEIVVSISIGVIVLAITAIFLIRYYVNKKAWMQTINYDCSEMHNLSVTDIINAVTTRPKLKLFLAYCLKNPSVNEVIECFVDVLTLRFHCEVIVSNYTTACRESDNLGSNHLLWVNQHLQMADFVLVMSPDFNFSMIESKDVVTEDQSMFLHCMNTIRINSTMQWSDRNVCVFRFDHYPCYKILTDLVSTTWCFPQQLGNFFAHLHQQQSLLESDFQEYWQNDILVDNFRNAVLKLQRWGDCASNTSYL